MFSGLESHCAVSVGAGALELSCFPRLLLYHSRTQVYKFNANGSQTGDPIQGKRRGCLNIPSHFHALETSNVLT